MSAGAALQAEVARALDALGTLTGIYDGPPARAAYPYAAIDAGAESDWSHKSGEGREVLIAVTIWDDQPSRLRPLADAVEQAIRRVTSPQNFQLVTLSFVRSRIVRDVAGPWAAAIDFRARLLAVD